METALTMPLVLFMVLGTLQLFLMLQARLMAEHAAFVANRAGSLSQGNCERMKHAALLTLLPTFTPTNTPTRLADAFGDHLRNRFVPATDWGHNGEIVRLYNDVPGLAGGPGTDEERFDDPDHLPLNLQTRLVFWYPMRIPFANWVIARTVLASWGLKAFNAANPLMPAQNASWTQGSGVAPLQAALANEFRNRTGSPAGTYVFPIQATAAMRMLTAPRKDWLDASPKVCN